MNLSKSNANVQKNTFHIHGTIKYNKFLVLGIVLKYNMYLIEIYEHDRHAGYK